ncbi:AMP-binding protein [Thioalkalivibrio sp. XN279]|uniref:AMP-binding protein n=1 Tax=Thioalkalivibrio sp. XN279 TaxID=2714953 RepID=UPI0019818609|nr:AMP-binding protein [Thioalkalivibrio sp. XN279]
MAESAVLQALETRAPDSVVLVGRERSWTATEVLAEAHGLAGRLAPGRVVGVLADNGPAWVVADLACQVAGAVHLPLPEFFNTGQLRHVLEQSGADTVITAHPERIGAIDLGFSVVGRWQGLHWMRRVTDPVVLPQGTAKISFTSGSTGTPKGVCLGLAGLHDTAAALCERLGALPLQRHLAVLPLALLLENVAGVYAPILRGMQVHLLPQSDMGWQGMSGFDPARLAAAIERERADSVVLVPELLKAWVMFVGAAAGTARHQPAFVAVGGARVAPELLAAARAAGIPACQGYGLTEAGSVVALNIPGDDGEGVGRPLPHLDCRVEAGELHVRACAFLGYVGVAAGADGPGGDWFPTGDLARFDAHGHLHLDGRCKNLLITSYGRNISPEWVESALLAAPAILQAVVCGDGEARLAAIVVPRPGAAAAEVRLAVQRVNRALPEYARIGRLVLSEPFHPANGLATGNGRPRRAHILEKHSAALAAAHHDHEVSHHVVL